MQDIEQIKQGLVKQQQDLQERLIRIRKDVSHRNSPLSSDWEEQVVERENDEVLSALEEAAERELEQVELALRRIEQGNYRHCQVCDCLIPLERLQILPHTTYCTRCSDELESASSRAG